MSAKFSTILALIMSLVISSCGSEQIIEPTLTSIISTSTPPIPTQTLMPTTTFTPTLFALPTPCVKWNLTPEECANAGTHEYSTKTQVAFYEAGYSCDIDDSNIVFSIEFLSEEAFLLTDPFRTELKFTRIDQNTFTGEEIKTENNYKGESTITFNVDGFIEDFDSYDLEKNELNCSWVYEQKIIGLAVTKTPIPISSFTEYDSTRPDSTECINSEFSEGWTNDFPGFSLKYPSDWECGWIGDSGIVAFMISSADIMDTFNLKNRSGYSMMIGASSYSGEKLTDFFSGYWNRGDTITTIQEPSTLTINGQDAALVEYIDNGELRIEVVIVHGNWKLGIIASFPSHKKTEFRSIFEDIISTIEIK